MTIYAPFTSDQQAALNHWQRGTYFHPFTCPNDGETLQATEQWICPACDYTQGWAHDFMGDMIECTGSGATCHMVHYCCCECG